MTVWRIWGIGDLVGCVSLCRTNPGITNACDRNDSSYEGFADLILAQILSSGIYDLTMGSLIEMECER